MTNQLTIKTIMPAPPNWLAFHYASEGDKVSPWHWQPVMFVAHVIDDDGVEAIVPMIECEWGHVLPGDNMTVSFDTLHPQTVGGYPKPFGEIQF